MAEYIEREALEIDLNGRLYFLSELNGEYDQYTMGFFEAVTRVKNFPSADVAPVVRRKDCCHSYNINGRLRCSHGICCGRIVPPDFYCAEGKRKENE